MKFIFCIKQHQIVQILSIVSASFTCLGYGMHYAWTSPSLPKLVNDKSRNITIEDASYFLVAQALGMIITAPLFSILVDKIGRKISVLLVAIPQIIGWIMIAFVKHIWLFYLAKFIVGIGDAAMYATIPIYICEITEPDVRNNWSNLIIIAAYSGICIINVLGARFDVWLTAIICFGYSCLLLVIFSWAPESPYYLLMKDRTDDARKVLRKLRMRNDVDDELAALTSDVKRQMSETGTWKDLFCIDSNRKALVLCLGLKVLQQFSGLIAFEVYAEYMFHEADVDILPSTSAISFTGTLLLSTTFSLFTVRRFGRKPLIIFSTMGSGLCLTAEAIYFGIKRFTDIDVSSLHWFPLLIMILYVLFCSCGLSSIPTLYVGEIFSTSIKSKANIANNIAFAVGLLVTPKIFQLLVENLGILAPFCLFAVCCFVGVVLLYMFIIETKGKTLEEIQQELKNEPLKSSEKL